MEDMSLSVIINIVILVLLSMTIVYAARLSLQLRNLRNTKADMERLVRQLTAQLDRADKAIGGMKVAAREAGVDLQSRIDRAISISDELQVIVDSGDRMADRLDELLDAARPMVAGADLQAGHGVYEEPVPQAQRQVNPAQDMSGRSDYAAHLRKMDSATQHVWPDELGDDELPQEAGFAIRDVDIVRGQDPLEDAEPDDDGLYTEAERDLLRAMQGRLKRG